MVSLAEPGSPKGRAGLIWEMTNFTRATLRVKVLAGHSTPEPMREVFSGEIIHVQKIIKVLELMTKWERPKDRTLRDTLMYRTRTHKEGTAQKWNEYLGVSVEEVTEGESVRNKRADKNFIVTNKYGTWEEMLNLVTKRKSVIFCESKRVVSILSLDYHCPSTTTVLVITEK